MILKSRNIRSSEHLKLVHFVNCTVQTAIKNLILAAAREGEVDLVKYGDFP